MNIAIRVIIICMYNSLINPRQFSKPFPTKHSHYMVYAYAGIHMYIYENAYSGSMQIL